MSFADDVRRFSVKIHGQPGEVLEGMVAAMHDSITNGSAVTGAPGQPVDTGFLKNSWQPEVAPDRLSGAVYTNTAYAPVIEYNTRTAYDPKGERPARAPGGGANRPSIKSTVGGHGSVRLTLAGADRLQAVVVAELQGRTP